MILHLNEIYDIFKNSKGISTDTRVLVPGELFFAIKGDNFDGNLFVDNALKKGAIKAVSSDVKYKAHQDVVFVDDTLQLLQDLAKFHRSKFEIPVIAITGTNGKTTTKELVCSILKEKYNVLCTKGNFNNHIGVPLMILQLQSENNLAVIEMGASGVGEIMTLCNIAMPTHGLITGIGKAHIEGFKTIGNIIKTKLELYDYLKQKNGVFFYNREISQLSEFVDEDDENVLSFTADDFKGKSISEVFVENSFPFLKLKIVDNKGSKYEVKTNLYGEYNFMNITNAMKLADYFDVDIKEIQKALSLFIPNNNRSQILNTKEGLVILDAYNANPTSMQMSINSFEQIKTDNKKYMVLGDMLELGEISIDEHINLINRLDKKGFYEMIFFVGNEFLKAKDQIQIENPRFAFFKNILTAKEAFTDLKLNKSLVLIKASRGIQAEKIIE